MANIQDYLPGGKLDPNGGLDTEIQDAAAQQQERQDDATPVVIDWEKRYKELEVHNSRQAQTLGQQRQMIDEFIINPTPAEPVVEQELVPITTDDLYDNPAEAVNKTVDAHPAIQEAKQLIADMKKRETQEAVEGFEKRHPDYSDIAQSPEFRTWVEEDVTRVDLYQRGNQYDLSAADALFSYYKADKGITQMTTEQEQAQAIAAASLEDSSALMVADTPKYSRSEFVAMKQRAAQGDHEADQWVRDNVAAYRGALASQNVRD